MPPPYPLDTSPEAKQQIAALWTAKILTNPKEAQEFNKLLDETFIHLQAHPDAGTVVPTWKAYVPWLHPQVIHRFVHKKLAVTYLFSGSTITVIDLEEVPSI